VGEDQVAEDQVAEADTSTFLRADVVSVSVGAHREPTFVGWVVREGVYEVSPLKVSPLKVSPLKVSPLKATGGV